MVSLDFYVNETNSHADYVLPTTTMYERDDVPVALLSFFSTPFIQVTEAVTEPPGRGARGVGGHRRDHPPDRQGALQRARAAGAREARRPAVAAAAGRPAAAHRPERRLVRPAALGAQRGQAPAPPPARAGAVRPREDRACCGRKLRTPSKRIDLAPAPIVAEIGAPGGRERRRPDDFPLRLIGLRELRSHNSWMHNAPLLMRGERVQALRVHPDDAAEHGLEDGGTARLESKSGAVEVPVAVTDEMTPGAVALPHGWGHGGGWQLANAQRRREREPARQRRRPRTSRCWPGWRT